MKKQKICDFSLPLLRHFLACGTLCAKIRKVPGKLGMNWLPNTASVLIPEAPSDFRDSAVCRCLKYEADLFSNPASSGFFVYNGWFFNYLSF